MAPILEAGQTVAITPARFYLPGDVVAFEATDSRILVHRVLGYDHRGGVVHYVTGADAATGFDDPVPAVKVLGRVSHIRAPSSQGTRAADRVVRIPISARLSATARYVRLAMAALRRRSRGTRGGASSRETGRNEDRQEE